MYKTFTLLPVVPLNWPTSQGLFYPRALPWPLSLSKPLLPLLPLLRHSLLLLQPLLSRPLVLVVLLYIPELRLLLAAAGCAAVCGAGVIFLFWNGKYR